MINKRDKILILSSNYLHYNIKKNRILKMDNLILLSKKSKNRFKSQKKINKLWNLTNIQIWKINLINTYLMKIL